MTTPAPPPPPPPPPAAQASPAAATRQPAGQAERKRGRTLVIVGIVVILISAFIYHGATSDRSKVQDFNACTSQPAGDVPQVCQVERSALDYDSRLRQGEIGGVIGLVLVVVGAVYLVRSRRTAPR